MAQEPVKFVENELIEVGPGVWIRVAVDNIAWADLGNGAAVIDALEDPSQADVVRSLIHETTGKELKWVVQTHWDRDHIACNPQWKQEGATVIAHRSCAEAAGEWSGRPDLSYDDAAVLEGDFGKRIEMKWWGGTHTPCDTVLHLPHARVLHVGDLFGWGLIPCRPTPEKCARLREVYAAILEYDVDVILCGHGPPLTPWHIARMQKYFEELLLQVPALSAAGETVEEIEQKVLPPEDMRSWWRFVEWKHRHNISMIADEHRLS